MKYIPSISILLATTCFTAVRTQNETRDHPCAIMNVTYEAHNTTVVPDSVSEFEESPANITHANLTTEHNATLTTVRPGRFRALSNRISGLFKLRRRPADNNQTDSRTEPAFVKRRSYSARV